MKRFNPFSAGRGIKSRKTAWKQKFFLVSILFLLEGASNLKTGGTDMKNLSFQSFFCWKGHQILCFALLFGFLSARFNPFSAGRGIKS